MLEIDCKLLAAVINSGQCGCRCKLYGDRDWQPARLSCATIYVNTRLSEPSEKLPAKADMYFYARSAL